MPRVGIIIPSSNTSVEIELGRYLPPDVSVHAARMPLTQQVGTKAVEDMIEHILDLAGLLASAAPDLIVVAATVPSLLRGAGWDRELIDTIERDNNVPATTTSTAMISALHDLDIKSVVLGTPFDEKMNAAIASFLKASGFEVLAQEGLSIKENLEIGRLPPDAVRSMARRLNRPEADAMLFACTNWAIMDQIASMEQENGKPVIGTTQATIRTILQRLGRSASLPDLGRLFGRDSVPVEA